MKNISIKILAALSILSSGVAHAEDGPLSFMYGKWRGEITYTGENGGSAIQTERVGPMLNEQIVLVEGLGYSAAGEMQSNNLAIISLNNETQQYESRLYANGNLMTTPFNIKDEGGFLIELPLQDGLTLRLDATIKDGKWAQTGTLIPEEGDASVLYSFELDRIGDADGWPAAGFVTP